MKFLTLSLSIIFICFLNYAHGQAKLIEKINRTRDDLVIPYEKYVLPNGLTLIVHEDHSDPIAHVDVTYHVGSAREELGKSGFAHFFEHMLFQGSDHVGDDEHFKIVQEAGGTLNGSTNRDRTNYYQTIPVNQLEKILWLEADRMGFFLDAVTQKKFEIQRSTVKNERGENYDNVPYGQRFENIDKKPLPIWPSLFLAYNRLCRRLESRRCNRSQKLFSKVVRPQQRNHHYRWRCQNSRRGQTRGKILWLNPKRTRCRTT